MSNEDINRAIKELSYIADEMPSMECGDWKEAIHMVIKALEQQEGYWTIKQYQVPIKNKQTPTISNIVPLPIEPTACKIVYTYTHSFCKSEEYLNKYNYCPNCGARMVEPQESESKRCAELGKSFTQGLRAGLEESGGKE